jgi:hypothetical protein
MMKMPEKTPLRLALEAARARGRAEKVAEVAASRGPAVYQDVEPEPDPDAYDERWLTATERRAVQAARAGAAGEGTAATDAPRVYREGGVSDLGRSPRVWHGL